MSKKPENPGVNDLREIEVLRFLFELKKEQIDPVLLQTMLLDRQIQNQVRQLAQETNDKENADKGSSLSPQSSSSSGGGSSAPSSSRSNDDVPDPNIIFKYSTPSTSSSVPIFNNSLKPSENSLQDRCEYINLKDQAAPSTSAASVASASASSSHDSDSDQENIFDNKQLKKLSAAPKITNWCGSSIYNNLPELAMTEYDKMLRESHAMKVEVIEALNNEFPVSYDYNPKKSRIRTNYADPQIADDRTRNNIASRRSRQRKKFQTQMIQYSVDYDVDENFLMEKQEKWLMGIISNLEQKLVLEDGGVTKLRKMRQQSGFE